MSSVIVPDDQVQQKKLSLPPNDVIRLRGMSWDEYVRLRDLPENKSVRMYFSAGELLLMTIGQFHERVAYLVGVVLLAWSEKTGQPTMCLRHWTMRREDKEKGLEADNCWYTLRLDEVRGKKALDLSRDPAPDLALEVDITTDSHLKLSIYAALGVPELWLWENEQLVPYRLEDEEYTSVVESLVVPGFPLSAVSDLILSHVHDDDLTFVGLVRELL